MSSHGLPEVLRKKVDEYVDSLAPQIQPRITAELETFQQVTMDSLEDQIVGAFRSLFNTDKDRPEGSRGLDNAVPDAYGAQSLPFADEISKLTRGFTGLAGGATEDLRDIFDLTEGSVTTGGSSGGGGFKTFLSAAANAVQGHLEKGSSGGGGQRFELDGILGVISSTVKEAARNPEEKARMITPEIKEVVGAELRKQHAPLADQFTRIALDHIKRWLRGNTSTRDLGDGVKGEIEDHVKDLVKGFGGLFGSKRHAAAGSGEAGASRGLGDPQEEPQGHGFSKLISEKLSTGLGRVHRDVRLEFRQVLGDIEKQLFELLPDKFQHPLEKILGGNPFDAQLDRDATDRGIGHDIQTKVLSKIRALVQKVQETLRESILGVVNGGHRKFERQSWVFVQNMVEQKVQKYLPKVKITVPDDIGNEGVSVGAPATTTQQLGGGGQQTPSSAPPPPAAQQLSGSVQHTFPPPHPANTTEQVGGGLQQTFAPPPITQHSSYGGDHYGGDGQQTFPPPPTQHYGGDGQQTFPPPPAQHYGGDGQQTFPPPPAQQQHGDYNNTSTSTQHQQSQEYYPPPPPLPYKPQEYRPSQSQDHRQDQGSHQNPDY
ncbi:hypothetical protein B0T22DRAFT_388662 [Podospora appendiculata]|uniref:Uncharacterized protein n=1 Tax=Podospora appendiculata TaxID=314037 RepID=A0AAE0WYX5_9PEZI|nr:hypothetical protein B0T22DRAFT_388662 [Podospora appendiculata]